MQKTSAFHESPANGSVLIMLTLLQLATKDAVYYLEGQKKKRKKSAWMKWCIDYNSQHITEEFWFTLKKKNKYMYVHVHIKTLRRIF